MYQGAYGHMVQKAAPGAMFRSVKVLWLYSQHNQGTQNTFVSVAHAHVQSVTRLLYRQSVTCNVILVGGPTGSCYDATIFGARLRVVDPCKGCVLARLGAHCVAPVRFRVQVSDCTCCMIGFVPPMYLLYASTVRNVEQEPLLISPMMPFQEHKFGAHELVRVML